MLDWLDTKLAAENTDPPMLDLKYFAEYDTDFGFKVSVDGIHNVPNRSFYVVIISTNPPASLYTESKLPTPDVSVRNNARLTWFQRTTGSRHCSQFGSWTTTFTTRTSSPTLRCR